MDFVKRNVCDKVLKDGLALVRLGNQYVFKTKRACDRIKIESAGFLSENEKRRYSAYDKNIKGTITGGVEAIKARYRRANDVFFIDEILERYR